MGIYAHNLVICPGSQEFPTRREPDGVDGAGVIAHRRQLFGLVVFRIGGIVDCLGRPDPHIAILKASVSV